MLIKETDRHLFSSSILITFSKTTSIQWKRSVSQKKQDIKMSFWMHGCGIGRAKHHNLGSSWMSWPHFNPDCVMFCHSFPWEKLDKSGCWQFVGCLLFAVSQRWETAEEKHTSYRRWPGFGSSCERKPNYSLSVLECFLLAANKSIYRPNSILFCPHVFFLYR